MHNHLYNSKLAVDWLKEQCQINGQNFSARFKICTGRYPHEYYTYHRIEASKLMLKRTEQKVTIIAIEVGYNSVSAFCKAFKRETGQTPSEWRNNSTGTG